MTAFFAIALIMLPVLAFSDELPIAGSVTAVDATAKTLTVEARAKGKIREVVIDIRPSTKIVRFVRAGSGPIQEQPAALADIRPGSTVSVTTRHEGEREIAELVRIVHEK